MASNNSEKWRPVMGYAVAGAVYAYLVWNTRQKKLLAQRPEARDICTDGTGGHHALGGFKTVSIDKSVDVIEKRAFRGCSSIASVTIHKGVGEIREHAFSGCVSLASVNVNSSEEDGMPERAFTTVIASVVPEGMGNLCAGIMSFSNMSFASALDPKGVKKIGANAFWGCSNLASITIPEKMREIEPFAFDGCSSLTSIDLPKGMETIGKGAFVDCTSLRLIIVPDTVKEIGCGAFERCTVLPSVRPSFLLLCLTSSTFFPSILPLFFNLPSFLIPCFIVWLLPSFLP
jgi:hypothetical protein